MERELVSKVADLRERAGLTQRQLAIALDVTESTIANWERGRNGLKWFKMVADLCKALGCSPNDLFGYEVPERDGETS
jgi:transcriptional regulator with XRE-family HTH domain